MGSNRGAPALGLVMLFLFGAGASDTPSGSLSGRVVRQADRAPLEGLVVHAADAATGQTHASPPTGIDGSFTLAGLPPATYEVAVQSADGLYVAEAVVRLPAGEHRTVQIAVEETPVGEPVEHVPGTKTRRAWTHNPLTATIATLGAAVVTVVAMRGGDPLSPSAP